MRLPTVGEIVILGLIMLIGSGLIHLLTLIYITHHEIIAVGYKFLLVLMDWPFGTLKVTAGVGFLLAYIGIAVAFSDIGE